MFPRRPLVAACALFLLAPAACTQQSELSAAIERHFAAAGKQSLDLAAAVPGAWERVCFFGPYANNQAAEKALGFAWDLEQQSSIKRNDGISLLLFVHGNTVVHAVEHSRSAGDFSNLAGRCFARATAAFVQVPSPRQGWPGLFPKNEG